jgi:hypothetical protein
MAQHGRIVYEAGFGKADVRRNIAFTPDTPVYLAFINKTIHGDGDHNAGGTARTFLQRLTLEIFSGIPVLHAADYDPSLAQSHVWHS